MNHDQLFELTRQQLLADGLSQAEAERRAREFVSIHDIVIIDPVTGEEHVYLGNDDQPTRKDGGGDDGNGIPENVSRQKDG